MKMKSLILNALSALLVLILPACGKHEIEKGVVIDKSMTPMRPCFILSGKTCVPVIHPKKYRLLVKDNEVVEMFNVNRQKYLSTNVGDSIWFGSIDTHEGK